MVVTKTMTRRRGRLVRRLLHDLSHCLPKVSDTRQSGAGPTRPYPHSLTYAQVHAEQIYAKKVSTYVQDIVVLIHKINGAGHRGQTAGKIAG